MIGEEIRKARQNKGMTQEKLAFEAGISRNYVSLLELNQKSPTVDVWLRICDALDVSAAAMIKRVQRKR